MRAKTRCLFARGVALGLAVLCIGACLMVCGCGKTDDRTAGKAMDYVITEQDVIDYLDDFREGSATTSDEDWAAWMGKQGATPVSLRKEVINYLGENYLVERAAGLRGVTVSDDEVDQKVQEQKDLYSSDLAWNRALINSGYTEEYYKLSIKSDLLKEKLKESFADPATVSDEELESEANLEMSNRIARRTSAVFIECDKDSSGRMAAKAKATDARNELESGASFADVFKKYSSTTHSEDGDMGYDMVSVPNLEYRSALNDLDDVGDISPVVEADDGYYVIVVTDKFELIEGNKYKLKQFPQQLLDYWRSKMSSSGSNEEYDEFMKENVSDVTVAVEPMPEGLPYDIEPTGGEASDSSSENNSAMNSAYEDDESSSDSQATSSDKSAEKSK